MIVSAVPRLTFDSPAVQAILKSLELEPREARAPLGMLVELLDASDVHASVDDFIRDNPSVSKLVKVAIASELFVRLYEREGHFWIRRDKLLAAEMPQNAGGSTSNWCRQFVGVCRPFLRKIERPAKLTVINFNYDRVMETVLRHFWIRSEFSYHEFGDCFEFVYPYGAFDDLPERIPFPADWICHQAAKIGLAGGEGQGASHDLQLLLDEAHTIFSVGFSFARANTELLGYNAHHALRTFYQNYDGQDSRLDRVLSTFCIEDGRSDHGSMSQLIANGFFEQRA